MKKIIMIVIVIIFIFITSIYGNWGGWNNIVNYAKNLLANSNIGDGSGTATVRDVLDIKNNIYLERNKYIQTDITGTNQYRSMIGFSSGADGINIYTIGTAGNEKITVLNSNASIKIWLWSNDGSIVVDAQTIADKPLSNGRGTISFYKKTADPTMRTGYAGIYSKDVVGTSEMFVIDDAGNVTQISPHDPQTGKWIFFSKNIKTGKALKIEMEELIFDLAKEMQKKTGKKYIKEWTE